MEYGYMRLHTIWKNMKHRCSPTGDAEHRKNYYDRGIRVCDEWQKFENFYEWAINNGYREDDLYESGRNKITIDRIDNNGNYEPSNCRWITFEENQYNKQHTMYANYKGKIKNILEISKETGLEKSTIRTRIIRGKGLYDPYVEKKDPKYLYKGEELTLGEISKKYNIDVKFLRTRMKLGWSIDEAMSLPKQKMRKEITKYKYNNNYYCIAELARLLGLKRTTLQYRIANGIMKFEKKEES